jgi:chemotaxis protein CheC
MPDKLSIGINKEIIEQMQFIVEKGFANAAKGFSQMVGLELSVDNPEVKTVPLNDIPMLLGGPENDAVGIYLKIEGDIGGQIMLILPLARAMSICDMLLEEPDGTTQELGSMERSALAEVGNLTGTFFLNAIAESTGLELRPTPPAVMVDMIGAILSVVIATMNEVNDNVLMFQATYKLKNRKIDANFWIVPDALSLERLFKDK